MPAQYSLQSPFNESQILRATEMQTRNRNQSSRSRYQGTAILEYRETFIDWKHFSA